MKKIILLFILVLFITGCKATVNVNIDKDNVTEKVSVYEKNTTTYNNMKNWEGFPVPLYYNQDLEVPSWMPNREKEQGVPYYNVEFNDDINTITGTGKFSFNNYKRSSLVNNCFKLSSFIGFPYSIELFSNPYSS